MRNQILEDLKQAMKNQDKEKLSVIRMVKGAIQMEELNTKRELTDEEVITIIQKQIKTRKESIVEFEKGNRQDLIDKTNKEIEILSVYMPEQLSEEEIDMHIEKVFKELNPTSTSDMGKIMGTLTPILKGKADMSLVSKKIREKLQNL
jgi:uncharacterized protein YqeY